MPSITVPSPGISSPAAHDDDIAPGRVRRPPCGCRPRSVATVSLRIERSVSAWARPRPSANASARLANTTVSHSQTAIDERVPAGSDRLQRVVAGQLDEPGDRGDQRADLDDEHHRVADLDARVELDEAVDQRAARRCSPENSDADCRPPEPAGGRRGGVGVDGGGAHDSSLGMCAVEREVEFQHVDRRLTGEAEAASAGEAVDECHHGGQRQVAHRGDAVGLDRRRWPARCRGRRPRPRCRPRRPGPWTASARGRRACSVTGRPWHWRRSPVRSPCRSARSWRMPWRRRCPRAPSPRVGSGSSACPVW